MLKIIDYRERQNSNGETFFALILQGGLEFVRSKETGFYYATSPKASMPCTFDEEACKDLIGKEVPGHLEKFSCEPYEVVDQESGEIREMDFRWTYLREGESVGDIISVEKVAELA
jgi:hypothetical protein